MEDYFQLPDTATSNSLALQRNKTCCQYSNPEQVLHLHCSSENIILRMVSDSITMGSIADLSEPNKFHL